MLRLTIVLLLGLFATLSIFGAPPESSSSEIELAGTGAPAVTETQDTVSDRAPVVAVIAEPTVADQRVSEAVAAAPLPAQPAALNLAIQQVSLEVADAPTIADDATADIWYVTGGRVNLRPAPTTGNTPITQVLRGDAAAVLEFRQDGWAYIRTANGQEGYLSSQFLSIDRPNG